VKRIAVGNSPHMIPALGLFLRNLWDASPKNDHRNGYGRISHGRISPGNRTVSGPHQCGQFPQMAYGRLSTATISALRNCIIGL
jgi:hypothetical protein